MNEDVKGGVNYQNKARFRESGGTVPNGIFSTPTLKTTIPHHGHRENTLL